LSKVGARHILSSSKAKGVKPIKACVMDRKFSAEIMKEIVITASFGASQI